MVVVVVFGQPAVLEPSYRIDTDGLAANTNLPKVIIFD